jgi:hypothetical protein
MSVNNSTSTYFNSGAISFRSIQSTFGGNFNSVKFSTYRRNTNVDDTNPIVPDATENSSIATGNNLRVGTFRGSIKTYILTQSSTDTTLDIDAQSWNSNLSKNVIKYFIVSGTMNASSTGNTGGSFSATAYNMKFNVSGYIYGRGGSGGSPNGGNGARGGDAFYVSNSSGRGGTSARVEITVNSGGRIWAGGGGGGAGGRGSTGPALSCFVSTNRTYNVYSGGSTNPGRACNRNCPGIGGGWNLASNGSCYGTGGNRSRCRGRQERGQTCTGNYDRNCNYRYYYTVPGGPGGNGGYGGTGASLGSAATGGTNGNPGGTNYCSANGNISYGSWGNYGAAGGSWGQAGGNSAGQGGAGGRAIFGNSYSVIGASSNTVKGSY